MAARVGRCMYHTGTCQDAGTCQHLCKALPRNGFAFSRVKMCHTAGYNSFDVAAPFLARADLPHWGRRRVGGRKAEAPGGCSRGGRAGGKDVGLGRRGSGCRAAGARGRCRERERGWEGRQKHLLVRPAGAGEGEGQRGGRGQSEGARGTCGECANGYALGTFPTAAQGGKLQLRPWRDASRDLLTAGGGAWYHWGPMDPKIAHISTLPCAPCPAARMQHA